MYNGPNAFTGCDPLDPNLDAIGWYCGNSGGQTHPVGQKAPNACGLCDMAGNGWEWCWDWHGGGYYAYSPAEDPLVPESGTFPVIRGGSWSSDAQNVRAALRIIDDPGSRRDVLGFHLARTANP